MTRALTMLIMAGERLATQESFYDLYKNNDRRINQWIVGPQTYVDEDGNTQPLPSWDWNDA